MACRARDFVTPPTETANIPLTIVDVCVHCQNSHIAATWMICPWQYLSGVFCILIAEANRWKG